MGLVLLIWKKILRAHLMPLSAASDPHGPDRGRWPIAEAGLPPPRTRYNSSSVQNVPSNSRTSHSSSHSRQDSSTFATPGKYATRAPDWDSTNKPSTASSAANSD